MYKRCVLFLLMVILTLGCVSCEAQGAVAGQAPAVQVQGDGNKVVVVQEDKTNPVPEPVIKPEVTITPEYPLENEVEPLQYTGTYVIQDYAFVKRNCYFCTRAPLKFCGGFPEKNREPCPLNSKEFKYSELEFRVEYITGKATGKVMYKTGYDYDAAEADELLGMVCNWDVNWDNYVKKKCSKE